MALTGISVESEASFRGKEERGGAGKIRPMAPGEHCRNGRGRSAVWAGSRGRSPRRARAKTRLTNKLKFVSPPPTVLLPRQHAACLLTVLPVSFFWASILVERDRCSLLLEFREKNVQPMRETQPGMEVVLESAWNRDWPGFFLALAGRGILVEKAGGSPMPRDLDRVMSSGIQLTIISAPNLEGIFSSTGHPKTLSSCLPPRGGIRKTGVNRPVFGGGRRGPWAIHGCAVGHWREKGRFHLWLRLVSSTRAACLPRSCPHVRSPRPVHSSLGGWRLPGVVWVRFQGPSVLVQVIQIQILGISP